MVTDKMVEAACDSWYEGYRWQSSRDAPRARIDMRAALEAALAAAWVPCAERMPEDFRHVLVVRPGYERGHSFYFAYRARGDWIKNDVRCTPLEGVTHWMPLPASPKE